MLSCNEIKKYMEPELSGILWVQLAAKNSAWVSGDPFCVYEGYSVTINESKEKFRADFCCFSAIKNIVAPSSLSNFLAKLNCLGILVFVCLDESTLVSLK